MAAGRPEGRAQPATRFDDPEVERVSRLLEEYAERWRGAVGAIPSFSVPAYASFHLSFDRRHPPYPRVAGEGVVDDPERELLWLGLVASPRGVVLSLGGGGGIESVQLVPPDGAREAAALLVHLERGCGFLGGLLSWAEQREGVTWKAAVLNALGRYAPLLGRDYAVPELKPWTGDAYRDFLEAALTLVLYRILEDEAGCDVLAAIDRWRRRAGARVWAAAGPVTLAEAPGGRRYLAYVEPLPGPLGLPDPCVSILVEGDALSAAWFRFDARERLVAVSVLHASLLLHLERLGGALTRFTEAVEEEAKALERALEEALLAAEAGALLFG